jgi:hypothetical protein
LRQSFGKEGLHLAVDDGDGIIRALHLDLVRRKLAEARQHRTLRGKAHQIADFVIECAHER